MQVDAPTAPAAHTPGRRQRLAVVAENIRPGLPHVGQPVQGRAQLVQLFRTVRLRHTGRFRSQTVASGGMSFPFCVIISPFYYNMFS